MAAGAVGLYGHGGAGLQERGRRMGGWRSLSIGAKVLIVGAAVSVGLVVVMVVAAVLQFTLLGR